MDFYWELIEKDGTVTYIPPKYVAQVKQRLNSGQAIQTSDGWIAPDRIAKFSKTSKPYSDQKLLDTVAQVFNEPVETENGVQARWVKVQHTRREWERYYSKLPQYRLIGDEGGMLWVGFRLPTHMIDVQKHQYCSDEEIKRLT